MRFLETNPPVGFLASTLILAMLLIVSCSPSEDSGETLLAHGSDCAPITWEAFDADPLAFDQTYVCIEGQVIVSFQNVLLYPLDADVFWDRPVYLQLRSNAEALVQAGVGRGDHVRLQGTLLVEEACPFSIFAPPPGQLDSQCEDKIIDAIFEAPEVQILEPDRARTICENVDIELLLADPRPFNHRIICTEGVVAIQDALGRLAPEGLTVTHDTPLVFFASTGSFEQFPRPIVGESVSIAGLVDVDEMCLAGGLASSRNHPITGAYIEDTPPCDAIDVYTYEQARFNPLDPWQTCQQVDLPTVLENPLAFEAQLICTRGYLGISKDDYDRQAVGTLRIDVTSTAEVRILNWPHLDMTPIVGSDQTYEIVGYVDVWEECLLAWAEHATPNTDMAAQCQSPIDIELIDLRPVTDF